MYTRGGNVLFFFIAAALAAICMLGACTNDLKKIKEISDKEVNSPADTTRGVSVIYSDSANVKAQVFAPLMLEYFKDNKKYSVMPKGIRIILYDNSHNKTATITADTAYNMETLQTIKLRRNVVITSAKGDVFKSEELDWNQFTHQIISTKPIDIYMANGDQGHGTALETNEKFIPFTIQNQTGTFYMSSKLGQ